LLPSDDLGSSAPTGAKVLFDMAIQQAVGELCRGAEVDRFEASP
jgi:hypothetical protein